MALAGKACYVGLSMNQRTSKGILVWRGAVQKQSLYMSLLVICTSMGAILNMREKHITPCGNQTWQWKIKKKHFQLGTVIVIIIIINKWWIFQHTTFVIPMASIDLQHRATLHGSSLWKGSKQGGHFLGQGFSPSLGDDPILDMFMNVWWYPLVMSKQLWKMAIYSEISHQKWDFPQLRQFTRG